MSFAFPLRSLFLGNLRDALTLGLVDDSAGQATAFLHGAAAIWSSLPDAMAQETQYKTQMTAARVALDALHRPVCDANDSIVATVMDFGAFATFYAPEITVDAMTAQFARLTALDVADAGAWHEARAACLECSANYGHGAATGNGPLKALKLSLNTRSTWTAPSSTVRDPSVQLWRDRLGLIHYQTLVSATLAKALVRVQFEIDFTSPPIDRKDWIAFKRSNPDHVWLMRPTVVHEGNRRFVQSHPEDAPTGACCVHGRTRDLGSPTSDPGERELLLICGDKATMRFHSVELLDGIPGELIGRDNSDEHFVKNVTAERGWLP